jgi:micrococcal nuclease
MRRAVAALAGCVAALTGLGCGEDPKASTEGAVVARVGDGDTLQLSDGRRVRLVQIDAPELGEGECYSRAARSELATLAPEGTRVELQRDPKLDDTDRFDRLLRYVVVGGRNVNVELVRRGAASVWFVGRDRGRYASTLLAAADRAQRSRAGLWGACPGARFDPTRGVQTGR